MQYCLSFRCCEALDGNEERLVLLQEAERMQRMDDKLKSLQLNGLVEFSDKAAKYALRTLVLDFDCAPEQDAV